MTQHCPKCGMLHAAGEPKCDCGYELQWPPPARATPLVSWEEVRGFDGRIGRSNYVLRFLLPWIVGFGLLVLVDDSLRQWEPDSRLGVLSGVFLALTIYPWATLTVKRLHDLDQPGWLVLALLIPVVDVLVLLYFCAQPGTPGENQFGLHGPSAFRSDSPDARIVSRNALIGALVVMVGHVTLARVVIPVFANMFASVNLALPQPTKIITAWSGSGLLSLAFIALDAAVVLLWFRYVRPTWTSLLFGLGLTYAVITGGAIVAMYLPIFDMINAVQ